MKGKVNYKDYYDYKPDLDYDSETGYYYNKAGEVVMHDGVYRKTRTSEPVNNIGRIVKYYIVYRLNKQAGHCVNPKTGEVEVPRQLVFVTKDIEAVNIALEEDNSLMYETVNRTVPLTNDLTCVVPA